MAVKSALKLVIKGRGIHPNYNLKKHIYSMIELFLLLRGKLFGVDDKEIRSLMINEWDLHVFIQELIQALMPTTTFGGYQKSYHEEIEVVSLVVCLLAYVYAIHLLRNIIGSYVTIFFM